MNDSDEISKRIDDYLDGRAGEDDVQRLDAMVREDPGVRRELLISAALETNLRQVLANANLQAGKLQPRRIWRMAIVARRVAVLVIAIAGWLATGLYAQRYQRAEGALADKSRQLTELQTITYKISSPRKPNKTIGTWVVRPASSQPDSAAKGPELFDTRGMVLSLPDNEDYRHAVTLGSGSAIPTGRKMWTCPWGGAGTRYPDGTMVSMDRDTLASFSEANNVRQIHLERGILSVTHRPSKPGWGMVLQAPQGTVTFDSAEVTMAVIGNETIVELAGGKAEFRRASDGKIVKLTGGQYAIIGSNAEFAAVSDYLRWRLEPPGSRTD